MIGFEEAAYFVLESNPSSVNVCVALNGTTEREVKVTITAVDISATSQLICFILFNVRQLFSNTGGSDFLFNSSILTFPAGDNSPQCISPSVLTDVILEFNETYLLNLTTTDDDIIIDQSSTSVTVVNDDSK